MIREHADGAAAVAVAVETTAFRSTIGAGIRVRSARVGRRRRLLSVAVLLCVAFAVYGDPLIIKLATVAPQGSPWDDTLRALAGRIYEISGGEITVKVYPDGIVGDESDLVRKMRLGRLNGAALTQLSLASIVPEILALSTPFLVESSDEFAYLIDQWSEPLRTKFEEEGFVVLTFGEAGWVHFFSTESVETPDDLRALHLAVPAGDGEMLQIWRRLGFTAYPLSMPDYAMGLQTGMIDAFYAPPSAVAAFGWYGKVGYMNSLPVAPVLGAIILTKRTWERIPEAYHDRIREIAEQAGASISAASRTLESESIALMVQAGVEIVQTDPEAETAWRSLGEAGAELAVGRLFPPEALDVLRELLRSYR